MNTQTKSMKGARTFVLGMLAGASIVAGGLVLARGQHFGPSPAVMIRSEVPAAASGSPAVVQTNAQLPAAIDLPRAVVVGHRLKILVRSDLQQDMRQQDLRLGRASYS